MRGERSEKPLTDACSRTPQRQHAAHLEHWPLSFIYRETGAVSLICTIICSYCDAVSVETRRMGTDTHNATHTHTHTQTHTHRTQHKHIGPSIAARISHISHPVPARVKQQIRIAHPTSALRDRNQHASALKSRNKRRKLSSQHVSRRSKTQELVHKGHNVQTANQKWQFLRTDLSQ